MFHKEHISGLVREAQLKYAYHFGHRLVSICVDLYVPNPRGLKNRAEVGLHRPRPQSR